jgi:hypothetical protein
VIDVPFAIVLCLLSVAVLAAACWAAVRDVDLDAHTRAALHPTNPKDQTR